LDKRLQVVEPEFFGLLQTMKRAGNTLSPVIRQGWDGDTLQVASRNTAAKATAPHISIIAHITLDELLDSLDDTSLFNGFANRFLWVLAKRAGRLPEGGHIPEQKLRWFGVRMHDVVRRAKKVGLIVRSERAKALWDEHYDRLTNDTRGGLLAAATARAAAMVLRLSCCYALLDGGTVIQVKHLESALAFWDYCDASARHVFGTRVGQRHADKILKALRSRRGEGLTRTEIYDLVFHRHANRDDITRALAHLAAEGLARKEIADTAGRPEERWFVL